MKKVGTDYVNMGDTRKRPTSGIVWTVIWGVLTILWIIFLGILINNGFKFDFSKAMFAAIFFCNIPTFVFVGGFFSVLKFEKRERTVEFKIHEYERWDYLYSKYEPYYLVEQVSLISTYVFYKHTGDYLDVMDDKELHEYCLGYVGYKTQDEAMLDIVNRIKGFIQHEKSIENIKIRNIKTMEVFTVSDLKEKVAAGDYEHLKEPEEK